MGRPSKLTEHQKREVVRRRDHDDEMLAEHFRFLNSSPRRDTPALGDIVTLDGD
jgi:hypothetical protein